MNALDTDILIPCPRVNSFMNMTYTFDWLALRETHGLAAYDIVDF
jgi:hypothetical protein